MHPKRPVRTDPLTSVYSRTILFTLFANPIPIPTPLTTPSPNHQTPTIDPSQVVHFDYKKHGYQQLPYYLLPWQKERRTNSDNEKRMQRSKSIWLADLYETIEAIRMGKCFPYYNNSPPLGR